MKISKDNLPANPIYRFKSKKLGLVALFMLIALIGLGLIIKNYTGDKAAKRRDQNIIQKVDSLNKPDVPCEQVNKEIGNEPVDKYGLEAQQKLLEEQYNCFSIVRNYDKAIEVGKKLKSVYDKEGDKQKSHLIELSLESTQIIKKSFEQDAKNNKPE